MVRTYHRKTDRAERCNPEVLERAAERVISKNESLRKVAEDHNINFMTLHRYCKKKKNGEETTAGYGHPRFVFIPAQEKILVDYILKISKIYYGLTPTEIRQFAYQFAVRNKIEVPSNWTKTESAGRDWFTNFIKRNPTLSTEVTNLSRAANFNKHNVGLFYNTLAEVFEQYKFQCYDIYNVDEMDVTTVQNLTCHVARKKAKKDEVAEKGTLVTLVIAVSASGTMIPPMFVFPRAKFREHFIKDGPPGCIGAAHPSGSVTEKNFIVFMKHFVSVTKCTKGKPVLLLLNNHDSYFSLELVDYCTDNGVVLVTFPPHCSDKLQPLDMSINGPFKKFFSATAETWNKKHPGKTMTINDLPGIVAKALPKATTLKNIQKRFKVTGIFPYNRNVFEEEEFQSADVMDSPEEHAQKLPEAPEVSEAREMGDDRPATVADPSQLKPAVADGGCTRPTPKVPQDLSPSCQPGTSHENLIPDPVPTTSSDISGSSHTSPTLTKKTGQKAMGVIKIPKALRRFKKVSTKKVNTKKVQCGSNEKRYIAILTDTREKMKLQASVGKKSKIYQRNMEIEQKFAENDKKRKTSADVCLACGESWSSSAPGEKWVQCDNCKDWAHDECLDGDDSLCHLCE